MKLKLLLILCIFASICTKGQATIRTSKIITSGMVLQRNEPIKLWGSADKDDVVTVSFVGKNLPKRTDGKRLPKQFTAAVGSNGSWVVELPALKAGGPFTIRIADNDITDVMVGDVYLCSGQSNMELPVRRVAEAFRDEVASEANDNIRIVTIPKIFAFDAPKDDLPAVEWKKLAPQNVSEISALSYFMSKKLQRETGVPIGIVCSCWGGTTIESWISREGLQDFPRAIAEADYYASDDFRDNIKRLEGQQFYRWNAVLYSKDAGRTAATPWFATDFDDSKWEEVVPVADGVNDEPTHWGSDGTNAINGSHWLRRAFEVSSAYVGQSATLRLGCIVDADSVYVNGTFVGTTSYQYPPRIYNIPKNILREGKNVVTVRVISQGGEPHFVQEKPYKIVFADGGEIDLRGVWRYHVGAQMIPGPPMEFFCYKATSLYNAMIAPLLNLHFSGVVWYQGESNVGRHNEYARLLAALMADWRKAFATSDLKFFIVELADFLHSSDPGRAAWAELRKAQAAACNADAHAYLVKNSDLGEWNDIHPIDKKTIAERVAEKILRN
ncbi:MAG: sialate O-acetylesterase [Marinilabiliaceae bacterium]|nr:sialate O-acetylesterase [Marinilabiliaceae bacterium]